MLPHPDFKALQDIVVYQLADGSYQLFNKYCIEKQSHSYVVTMEPISSTHSFSSLKTATAWCIFDKRMKFYESRRILELDAKLSSLDFDFNLHQKMLKRATTPESQLIAAAKLYEAKVKKQSMSDELESYLIDSKNWQHRRFDLKPA